MGRPPPEPPRGRPAPRLPRRRTPDLGRLLRAPRTGAEPSAHPPRRGDPAARADRASGAGSTKTAGGPPACAPFRPTARPCRRPGGGGRPARLTSSPTPGRLGCPARPSSLPGAPRVRRERKERGRRRLVGRRYGWKDGLTLRSKNRVRIGKGHGRARLRPNVRDGQGEDKRQHPPGPLNPNPIKGGVHQNKGRL